MTENENAEMIEQARQYFLNGFTAAEIKILLPISSAALQEIITEQRRVGAESHNFEQPTRKPRNRTTICTPSWCIYL